jgi:hypothetical protein
MQIFIFVLSCRGIATKRQAVLDLNSLKSTTTYDFYVFILRPMLAKLTLSSHKLTRGVTVR